jgi:Patatin-like phospholipase
LAPVPLSWLGKEERRRPPAGDRGLLEKVPAEPRLLASRAPRRRFLRWLFNGSAPEPVPSVHGPVEKAEEGKLGICCSGGGIRSAAFSLGALQQLQEKEELKRASYLAAVSGGSYIAGAISLVHKAGPHDSEADLLQRLPPFAEGSPEEQYLRNRSSYLAPSLTDKIFLGWRIVLGLVINLIFVALPLIALALLLSGFAYASALPDLSGECHRILADGKEIDCAVQPPLWFWLVTFVPLGLGVLFGAATLLPRWRNYRWQSFFSTWATRLLIVAAVLGLLFFAVPFVVEVIRNGHVFGGTTSKRTGLGAGTLTLLAGVAAQLGQLLRSSKTAEGAGAARKLASKLGKGARLTVAYLAAALVGPLLFFGVFVFTVAAALSEVGPGGALDNGDLAWIGAGVFAAFLVIYFFSDITNWSLHPFYKRRLATVFALKRVRASALDAEERERVETVPPAKPEHDVGIAVERDYDELVPISNTALSGAEGEEWPTLLVCAAANISDSNATPPGRRVTSFTFSANAVGGPLIGAVPTWQLETAFETPEEAFPNIPPAEQKKADEDAGVLEKAVKKVTPSPARKRRGRDLTLLAAIAMSGAAISPSMGKMTKRPLTFLMALANVRLGVWVPNPRWVGELGRRQELRLRYVRPRPFYLLCELLGLNRISSKYLYVTDGGHYENLGLVELLRRGCTEIYCLDASGLSADGAEFESLGEAITLARSELGVEIEFAGEQGEKADEPPSPADMVPDKETHFAKRDVVMATIRFPVDHEADGEEQKEPVVGKLVYVRNALTGEVPWDVRAHHEADPRFPNNSTVDQLYTDQKFEAYRVLGSRAAKRATEAMGVAQ